MSERQQLSTHKTDAAATTTASGPPTVLTGSIDLINVRSGGEINHSILDATTMGGKGIKVSRTKSNIANAKEDKAWKRRMANLKAQVAEVSDTQVLNGHWASEREAMEALRKQREEAQNKLKNNRTRTNSLENIDRQIASLKNKPVSKAPSEIAMKPFSGTRGGRRMSIQEGLVINKKRNITKNKKSKKSKTLGAATQLSPSGTPVSRSKSGAPVTLDVALLTAAAKRSDRCHDLRRCGVISRDWRIYPHTSVQTVWILFTLFFVLWTAIVLPVTVAFIHSESRPLWWQGIDTCADVFFIIDVILNFRAVFLDTWGALITGTGPIAKNYIFGKSSSGTGLGWFWIDFPAAVPWSAFLPNDAASSPLGLRDTGYIFNLPKLARVFHLPSQVAQLPCFSQNKENGRIGKLFFLFLIVAHWFGCLWYWVGAQEWCKVSCYQSQGGDSSGACSWLDANELGHLPGTHLYMKSLYWAITTMTSVGYGDISPINLSETIVASVIMLIGSAMYATIFSNMASYIQSIDADFSNFQQKMGDVRQQMTYVLLYIT